MTKHRIYTTSFASVYPLYVAKAEKKGRTRAEVDQIIGWLTGYADGELEAQVEEQVDFETFFAEAPRPNPARADHGRDLRYPGGGDRGADDAGDPIPRQADR